jgi:hypothetical protein
MAMEAIGRLRPSVVILAGLDESFLMARYEEVYTLPATQGPDDTTGTTSVVDPDPDPDPKLFAGSRSGSGSVTRGYGSGSGSETGLKSY